jgi:hypothetical protein
MKQPTTTTPESPIELFTICLEASRSVVQAWAHDDAAALARESGALMEYAALLGRSEDRPVNYTDLALYGGLAVIMHGLLHARVFGPRLVAPGMEALDRLLREMASRRPDNDDRQPT